MAKSIKATKALERELEELNARLAEVEEQSDKAWAQIDSWPMSTITTKNVSGKLMPLKCRRILNEQTFRRGEDLERLRGRIKWEIQKVQSLLSPGPGRGKGSRNKNQRPPDPTIAQALEYRRTPEGLKLTLDQLAQKMNPGGNRGTWARFKYRFKKALTEENKK